MLQSGARRIDLDQLATRMMSIYALSSRVLDTRLLSIEAAPCAQGGFPAAAPDVVVPLIRSSTFQAFQALVGCANWLFHKFGADRDADTIAGGKPDDDR